MIVKRFVTFFDPSSVLGCLGYVGGLDFFHAGEVGDRLYCVRLSLTRQTFFFKK